MVRENDWKYVFLANRGREQRFDLGADPNERHDRLDDEQRGGARLREHAAQRLVEQGVTEALDGGDLPERPFQKRDAERIQQFNYPVEGFPDDPADALGE